MKRTVNLDKCPACGGVLSLDENTGIIVCQYCNNSFTYEELEGDELMASDDDGVFDEYSCSDCGGVIVTDQNSITAACPYCGNTAVMKDRVTGSYHPDYIIPFKITPKEAEDKFTQVLHYKMVRRSFKKGLQIEAITSLFVPFWLYNTDILAEIKYEDITRDKNGKEKKIMKNFKFTESYDKIPVDASLKMEDDKMDRIEPYDYSELKAFDKAYFIGHKAEKYDTDVGLMSKRAEKRMDKSARTSFSRCVFNNPNTGTEVAFNALGTAVTKGAKEFAERTTRTMGYEEVLSNSNFDIDDEVLADNIYLDRIKKSKVKVDLSDYRYALFPTYLIRGRYKGETKLFYVNGQTGKIAEDFPFDYLAYYLNRIVGTLIAAIIPSIIFFIGANIFIKLWAENNDRQPGLSGGMLYLIVFFVTYLLTNIMETKFNGKEALKAAKKSVKTVPIVQNAKNYRIPGSFKIIKD
jgi:DNA-directed RNA polymerase subunit RPC12/RpoP